jgi:diguanylate cyclase (GGDEF)-like protein
MGSEQRKELADMTWILAQHDVAQVTLALLVCVFGSYTVFSLADRSIRTGEGGWHIWMLGAGAAAGCAIWSTHFIAMLALDHAMPMQYETGGTFLSIAVAIIGSTLGLMVALPHEDMVRRFVGGALVATSIATMHFLGMTATTMAMAHVHDPLGLTLVLAAGVLLSVAATASYRASDARRRMASAGLLSLAVATIHFGSMASMRMGAAMGQVQTKGHATFAIVLALVVGMLLLLALLGASVANRMEEQNADAAERLRSLANMSLEGILVVDAGGVVVDANDQMKRLAGQDPVGTALATHLPDVCDAIRSGRAGTGAIETALLRRSHPELPIQAFAHRSSHVNQPTWTVVVRDLTEQREAESRIRHAASHDPLTDLPNRSLLMDRLQRAIARSQRSGTTTALLYIDLDGFKRVNDTHGHGRGDEVLKDVARILLENVRQVDTVARLGGDEFIVLQEDQSPMMAQATAQRLIDETARLYGQGRQDVAIGMSIGMAITPTDAADAGELVRLADVALYRAKADGRNQARFFERAMDQAAREQRSLETDLRSALGNGEIGIAYQPQMNTVSGEIVGFEALARWKHPTRGQVPPDVFIPVAERTGLIVQLGAWILKDACRTAAGWKRPLRVSVNLSPLQIRDEGLVALVEETLRETGLAPERLEIEITETAILRDERGTVAALGRMKALGLKIAMDDFGTGYSSLSSLHSFPFDKIKVDKSFVSGIEDDGKASTIVKAVIGLGHNLGLPIVAEGVENEAQLELLRAEGCTEIQGFLIGRPMAISEWEHLVEEIVHDLAA